MSMYFWYLVFFLFFIIYLFQWIGEWGWILLWITLSYFTLTLSPLLLAKRAGSSSKSAETIKRWINLPIVLQFYFGAMLNISGWWMLLNDHDFIGELTFIFGRAIVFFSFIEWRKLRK